MSKVFQLIEEEIEEAIIKAKQDALLKMNQKFAKSMLSDGMEIARIIRCTGLTKKEIMEIGQHLIEVNQKRLSSMAVPKNSRDDKINKVFQLFEEDKAEAVNEAVSKAVKLQTQKIAEKMLLEGFETIQIMKCTGLTKKIL